MSRVGDLWRKFTENLVNFDVRIVQVGSMIDELQELALDIFLFASSQ